MKKIRKIELCGSVRLGLPTPNKYIVRRESEGEDETYHLFC